jgi:hypothetical protein
VIAGGGSPKARSGSRAWPWGGTTENVGNVRDPYSQMSAQEHRLIVAIALRTKSIFLESIQSVTLQESCHFAVLGLQVAVAAQSS